MLDTHGLDSENAAATAIRVWAMARERVEERPIGMRLGTREGRRCIVMYIDAVFPRSHDDEGNVTRDVLAIADTWEACLALLDAVPAPVAPVRAPLTGTFAKLRSGGWGVRASRPCKPGDEITVRKRSGEEKRETIASDLGGGVYSIVETRPTRIVHTRFSSGASVYRNARGRCEDAPCCGCCS